MRFSRPSRDATAPIDASAKVASASSSEPPPRRELAKRGREERPRELEGMPRHGAVRVSPGPVDCRRARQSKNPHRKAKRIRLKRDGDLARDCAGSVPSFRLQPLIPTTTGNCENIGGGFPRARDLDMRRILSKTNDILRAL